MKTFQISLLLLAASLLLTIGCKKMLIAKSELGREYPGMSEKTLRKISKETGVQSANIVWPDEQAKTEMIAQFRKNELALPFVYLLNERKEQIVMADTLTKNQCVGLMEKYLLKGEVGPADGEAKKGIFYSVADSSIANFTPGKNYLVLAYMYELGKVNNSFYRSMQKMASNPEKNLQLFLVVLNGRSSAKSD